MLRFKNNITPKKPTRKRKLLRFFLILLLFIFIVVPFMVIFLTFEKTPIVDESETANIKYASRVRDLAGRTYKILFVPSKSNSLSVSSDDMNAVLAFIARGVSRFNGVAEISANRLILKTSLKVPNNPIGNYVNAQLRLLPSDKGLILEFVKMGKIKIPGSFSLFLLRFFMDLLLGDEQGSMLIYSVASIDFNYEEVTFNLRPIPELRFKRLKYLKERLKGVRDYMALLGDPRLVRLYYKNLLETEKSLKTESSVSLAQYLQPLFKLAKRRSASSRPEIENHAAIMALSIFAGSYRFERLIGPVRTETMKSYHPRTENIVLAGRIDLRLHFIISAGLRLTSDSSISFVAGEFKELLDAGNGGSGFSFADLAADRAGVKFADAATDPNGSAERIQRILADQCSEVLFFPSISDLPEGFSQKDFESVYSSVGSEKYKTLVKTIDDRISRLEIYSGRK